MSLTPKITGWKKGRVNRAKEHFELRYGSANDGGWDDWLPVALVGPPAAGVVKIQFLRHHEPDSVDLVEAVEKEIQFYLIDKPEEDPWAYAIHHCGTMANVYSRVHWSFYPNRHLRCGPQSFKHECVAY